MRLAALLVIAAMAGACAPPPDIGPAFEGRRDDVSFPALLPMAAFDPPAGEAPAPAPTGLAARGATLRARAAVLDGPVLTGAERRRLLAARARLGG